jgi:hypothetical protein
MTFIFSTSTPERRGHLGPFHVKVFDVKTWQRLLSGSDWRGVEGGGGGDG